MMMADALEAEMLHLRLLSGETGMACGSVEQLLAGLAVPNAALHGAATPMGAIRLVMAQDNSNKLRRAGSVLRKSTDPAIHLLGAELELRFFFGRSHWASRIERWKGHPGFSRYVAMLDLEHISQFERSAQRLRQLYGAEAGVIPEKYSTWKPRGRRRKDFFESAARCRENDALYRPSATLKTP